MPDIWLILVVVGGLLALAAATVLAAGNRSRPDDMTEPMSSPADPGAEGMLVSGPGEITPGEPLGRQSNDIKE